MTGAPGTSAISHFQLRGYPSPSAPCPERPSGVAPTMMWSGRYRTLFHEPPGLGTAGRPPARAPNDIAPSLALLPSLLPRAPLHVSNTPLRRAPLPSVAHSPAPSPRVPFRPLAPRRFPLLLRARPAHSLAHLPPHRTDSDKHAQTQPRAAIALRLSLVQTRVKLPRIQIHAQAHSQLHAHNVSL